MIIKDQKAYNILLLTNRDSDNVGDQVIEACDIGLIETVMENLDIIPEHYEINSMSAGIISKKYLATKNEKFLKRADQLIQESDIIIFGGAPLFNYHYQVFYERTAVTLELAEKYNKPVIFSAIGVEGYDEENEKCQRLKKALNFDCVKQITTRDDFESLQKFKENENMIVDKVSDPAVFASKIFKKYLAVDQSAEMKKIGVFVLRANGFKDNRVDFSREDSARLWKGLARQLRAKGYDYEFLTSGHFGDEAFLEYLISNRYIPQRKCVFNMNSPERLISKISSYDAVISCRLHPSIISFSLDVPSIGLVWNAKVQQFYESIGYEDRAVPVAGITPEKIVEKVEQSMAQGIDQDEAYLVSIYNTLFYGIRELLCPAESGIMPYSYSKLIERIPAYKGTSEEEQEEKIRRKFRRTYETYNQLFDKNAKRADAERNLRAEKKSIKSILKTCLRQLKIKR